MPRPTREEAIRDAAQHFAVGLRVDDSMPLDEGLLDEDAARPGERGCSRT